MFFCQFSAFSAARRCGGVDKVAGWGCAIIGPRGRGRKEAHLREAGAGGRGCLQARGRKAVGLDERRKPIASIPALYAGRRAHGRTYTRRIRGKAGEYTYLHRSLLVCAVGIAPERPGLPVIRDRWPEH